MAVSLENLDGFVIFLVMQVAAIREALSEEEGDEGKKEEVREEGA